MKKYFIIALLLTGFLSHSQQDPQYTQYMYNTQVVNPGYAGSLDAMSIGLLYRAQWIGLEGAPRTGTLTVHSPIDLFDRVGLGLSIINDQIGPATETNFTIDYSYKLHLDNNSKLALGLKGGGHVLNVDFNKLNQDPEGGSYNDYEVNNRFQPQIGVGAYYYTDRFYAGLSVPNFLTSKHYKEAESGQGSIAAERLHYYLISGYVFDLNPGLKLKPAVMLKAVGGAPLQVDVSANFMIEERFVLGTAYRWSSAVSALAGFHISNQVFAGVAYDFQTTNIANRHGSYEVFLRFNLTKITETILTPRFF